MGFLWGFPGEIPLHQIKRVIEEKRNELNPVPPDCPYAPLASECEGQILRAMSAIKAWRSPLFLGFGDREHLRMAAVHLRHAADAVQAAYEQLSE